MNKKIINSSLKMVQYILTTIAIFLQKMMDPKVEVTKPLLHKANTIAQTTWKEHPVVTFVALALLAIAFILMVRSIIHLLFKRK